MVILSASLHPYSKTIIAHPVLSWKLMKVHAEDNVYPPPPFNRYFIISSEFEGTIETVPWRGGRVKRNSSSKPFE